MNLTMVVMTFFYVFDEEEEANDIDQKMIMTMERMMMVMESLKTGSVGSN